MMQGIELRWVRYKADARMWCPIALAPVSTCLNIGENTPLSRRKYPQ